MTIKAAKIFDEGVIPTRKHEGDAGGDLYYTGATFNLRPFHIAILTTGIRVKIPHGQVGIVEDKSKNNYLIIGRVIDEIYQGEILVKVVNILDEPIGFKTGQQIAQLVIYHCNTEPYEEVDNDILFSEVSERGSTGGIVEQHGQ